jgi:hypothetical protein
MGRDVLASRPGPWRLRAGKTAALGIAATLAACGGGDGARDPADIPRVTLTGARRLVLDGARVLDDGAPIVLRGVNVEGVTEAEAVDLAGLGFNLVRLRISWEGDVRDDDDPTGLSARARADVDAWVAALVAQRVWTVLELRTDDETANDAALYTVGSATFRAYARVWQYLAWRYANTPYIAGYGLLAEPSPDKTELSEPRAALVAFHAALMSTITDDVGDTVTPFFLGPMFNYDTLQYRFDEYYTAHAARRGRLFYAVNLLMPKPWIQDGTAPDGSRPAYPLTPGPVSFDALLVPDEGEAPDALERIFNHRREEPENFAKLLGPSFAEWYLSWAIDFASRHDVPLYVDQFGAPVEARGQLEFERDLIATFARHGLHWARWSYNAGQASRKVVGNEAVRALYADVLGR